MGIESSNFLRTKEIMDENVKLRRGLIACREKTGVYLPQDTYKYC